MYAHDTQKKLTTMQCLPDSIVDHIYYEPGVQGAEAAVKTRLEDIKEFRKTEA